MVDKGKRNENLEQERQQMLASLEQNSELLSPKESNDRASLAQEERTVEVEHLKMDLANRLEKKTRRTKWDKVLTRLVVAGFILSYLMIILIGLGILNFPDNSFAVPSVVAVGIVETYGLAKLAVKYFFSEDGDSKKRRRK